MYSMFNVFNNSFSFENGKLSLFCTTTLLKDFMGIFNNNEEEVIKKLVEGYQEQALTEEHLLYNALIFETLYSLLEKNFIQKKTCSKFLMDYTNTDLIESFINVFLQKNMAYSLIDLAYMRTNIESYLYIASTMLVHDTHSCNYIKNNGELNKIMLCLNDFDDKTINNINDLKNTILIYK